MSTQSFTFRIASEAWEFEQIHKLNYKTFVEEIPQHQPNPDRVLVDKFHSENTYLICSQGENLVGMGAVRDKRPFSLDSKLDNLDSYLPLHRSVCELRLLAIEKNHRSPRVFQGIIYLLAKYADEHGYDLFVMSGSVTQTKLYKHFGFVPFGPLVGNLQAQFQPMYMTLKAIQEFKEKSNLFRPGGLSASEINLLPGPVAISASVRKTFSEIPVSHRSRTFMKTLAHTKQLLCEMVGARSVEIFTGSGTLANDIIAGQLSLVRRPGLVLANGEFGNRLIDHATRWQLLFRTIRADWGEPINPDDIERMLEENPDIRWIWSVHCETSSGILSDLAWLEELATKRGVDLCLDCTSSIGTVPVDLNGVYLASTVSGKGLGAFPGLSMVFYNHQVYPASQQLPRYLDLGLYASYDGVPFTISSNLVYALNTAIAHFDSRRFDEIVALSSWLKSKLIKSGLRLVGLEGHTSPAVITIALSNAVSSENVGNQLLKAGFLLSYRSEYLRERNWIQICLMGECVRETFITLVDLLARYGSSPASA